MTILSQIRFLIPEIIVSAGALTALVANALLESKERIQTPYVVLVSFATALLTLVILAADAPQKLLWGTYMFDAYAVYFKGFFLVLGTVIALLAVHTPSISSLQSGGEFASLLGFSIVGAMVAASAGDFITMVVAVETVSMLGYVLAGFTRTRLSREAAVKYVLYGAFSTAISLFGISMIFWATGQLEFKQLSAVVQISPYKQFVFAGLIIFLTGLFFKAAAVPFHMWSPDVYQGSPTLVTAYFSVGPKAAAFAVIGRVLLDGFARRTMSVDWIVPPGIDWPIVIAVISALTMTVGNLSALLQKDLKRMLAYSSIAHAGYMLAGFAAKNVIGTSGVLYYLGAYLLMNLGAFFVVLAVEETGKGTHLDSIRGLGWTSPLAGATMAIFLLSLTGIPPFAGFVGKLVVFGAVVKSKLYWLAVLGVLNSVISLGYYGLMLKKIYLERSDEQVILPRVYSPVLVALAALTVFLGICFNPLIEYTAHGAKLLGVLF